MQNRWIFVVGLCSLLMTGCGKKDEPQKTPPETGKEEAPGKPEAKAEVPKTVPSKTETAKPEEKAPGPEVAQCEQILDKGWKSIQPVLDRLRIEKTDTFEDQYKKSARTFLLRCQKLAPELRDCLLKSENPYMDMAGCKINDNKKVSERLFAPNLRRYIKLFESRPLPKAQGAKLLSSLKGRWVNQWKAARTRTVWKIDRRGKVSENVKVGVKKEKTRDFKISFVETGRMKIAWNPTSSQPFVFLMPNRKTFYATGNLAYGFYPMPNRKSFVVQNSGDYIFWKNGKCRVISSAGLEVEGQCQFTKRKKDKVFQVKYQFPGRVMLNDKPRIDQRVYYPVGKFLLHESLVAAGKFQRK